MLTLICDNNTLISINAGDHRFCHQLDISLLMPGKVANHHLLFGNYSLQKAWEGNAVVERIRFVGEQVNATIWVVLAQYVSRSCPCNPVADDHVSFIVCCQVRLSPCLLCSWLRDTWG